METANLKQNLTNLLGREPSVTKTKDNKFIVEYFKIGAPAKAFLGDSEDEALLKLEEYLKNMPQSPNQN